MIWRCDYGLLQLRLDYSEKIPRRFGVGARVRARVLIHFQSFFWGWPKVETPVHCLAAVIGSPRQSTFRSDENGGGV